LTYEIKSTNQSECLDFLNTEKTCEYSGIL
jgi:hypothetical protein